MRAIAAQALSVARGRPGSSLPSTRAIGRSSRGAGGDTASAFGGGATITSHLQTSASSLRHVKSLHRNGSEECAPRFARSKQMLDLIMVALGLAFFALSAGGTIACDRL